MATEDDTRINEREAGGVFDELRAERVREEQEEAVRGVRQARLEVERKRELGGVLQEYAPFLESAELLFKELGNFAFKDNYSLQIPHQHGSIDEIPDGPPIVKQWKLSKSDESNSRVRLEYSYNSWFFLAWAYNDPTSVRPETRLQFEIEMSGKSPKADKETEIKSLLTEHPNLSLVNRWEKVKITSTKDIETLKAAFEIAGIIGPKVETHEFQEPTPGDLFG